MPIEVFFSSFILEILNEAVASVCVSVATALLSDHLSVMTPSPSVYFDGRLFGRSYVYNNRTPVSFARC